MIDSLAAIVGPEHIATGIDAQPWARDWTGTYSGLPAAVVRPGSTEEVSAVVTAAARGGWPIVPVSGGTGLVGGGHAPGGLVLSLDRLRAVQEIDTAARTASVQAGVVLADLHAAAEARDLIFPMTFGAKGSARIRGLIATNAGGSNVLRYGSMRQLVLGLEAVMADGRVLSLMSGLRKDNTGLDLRQLLIGSEGTLDIVTATVLRLSPRPRAYATAMIAAASLPAALQLLNRLQGASGGAVEAFEYMPARFIARHLDRVPGARPPFAQPHDVNILAELGAVAARDAEPGPDGVVPLTALLEAELARALEDGLVREAVLAHSEAQRRDIWARREAAAEITFTGAPVVDCDIAVPLTAVPDFLERARQVVTALDPGATDLAVAHLGDGNVHYTVYPSRDDAAHKAALRAAVDDTALALGGSFSAEHGIGQTKLDALRRLKDPVAQAAMRGIKAALDPQGLLNPGKTIP